MIRGGAAAVTLILLPLLATFAHYVCFKNNGVGHRVVAQMSAVDRAAGKPQGEAESEDMLVGDRFSSFFVLVVTEIADPNGRALGD